MVQHRAAKFIGNMHSKKSDYKNVSISKLLNQLNLETLEERRTKARLTMVYKILNGHVILDSEMLPKFKNDKPRQCNLPTVGLKNQLIEPPIGLHVTKSTFFYSIQKIWNSKVTEAQAEAPSIDAFKNYMKKVTF